MKTKIKRSSRRVISVLLTVVLILTCMAVGVVSVNAYTFESGAKIYFDASAWYSVNDTQPSYMHVAFMTDDDNGRTFLMSRISNTSIWYLQGTSNPIASTTLGDDSGIKFFTANANWTNDSHYSQSGLGQSNISENNGGTGYYVTGHYKKINIYGNHVYYFRATGTTAGYGPAFDLDNNGASGVVSGVDKWKSYQKASVYVSNDGGSNYTYVGDSNTTEGGKVSVKYRTFNTWNSVSSKTETSSSSTYAQGSNVAKTTNVYMCLNETFANYSFQGWYSSDGTQLADGNTTTYQFCANTLDKNVNDVQARFLYTGASASYYVTSAGATDDDNGFTTNRWVANDADGGMESDDSVEGYNYSKTFTDIPVGTYRFKITDGSWTNCWGDNGSIDYTAAGNTANQTKENNGNAKFDLTKASDVTIYFNSSTHAIKVKTTDATVPDKYYIVGQANDGTRGMFYNVWGENWTSFNSADQVAVTANTEGSYTKEYTDFRGTTGTYTYKVIKVTSSGIAQYYPNDGDGQTVNVTGKTSKVTFTVTTDASGTITAVTAVPTEGGSDSDSTYDPIFIDDNKSSAYKLLRDKYGSQAQDFSNTSLQAYHPANTNDYYFKIPVGSGGITTDERYYMCSTSTSYTGCYSASSDSGYSVTTESRASSILTVGKKDAYGTGDHSGTDYRFSKVKFSSSSEQAKYNYVVLKYNSSSHNYTYDVYGSGGGGDITTLETVDIYARNGTLRDSTYNRFTNLANTDIVSITDPDGIVHTSEDWEDAVTGWSTDAGSWDTDKSGYSSNYDKVTKVPIGSTIKLRTYLSGKDDASQVFQSGESFADTHYLKAYSINGMTYQLHKASEATTVTSGYKFVSGDQYYEEDWKVEAVNITNMKGGKTIEITPIYYMKDNSNCKTFYIDGYIGDLQTKWGTLLCVYPYYEGCKDKENAFGGYPGQPMLYWGGKFQMEVPLTDNGLASGKQFKGLTMHNGYWDLQHRGLDTKCDDGHCQTYDYDDFHKIFKEKNADTIYYWFKYKTSHDNFASSGEKENGHSNFDSKDDYQIYDFADNNSTLTAATAAGWNGVELVTDYYGRQVDVFGNLLTSAQKSSYNTTPTQSKELLIVSTGYRDTYVGDYATLWAVYAPSGNIPSGSNDQANTLIGYISSSMLYLNNIDRVSQYTGGTKTSAGEMSYSAFKNTYDHLKKYYTGVPALISYEREIYNNSFDKANRSDGKWFYSMGNDKISANIKIQYTDGAPANVMDSNVTWTDDNFSTTTIGYAGEKNVGETTGCSAYFTNTTPVYLVGKTSATDVLVDNEKYFNFQANGGGEYEFVGWVRECGGEKNEIISFNGLGQSNISANDTYIARFKKVASGKLVISHNVVKDASHTGSGTQYLKVQILDGSTVKKEYVRTDGTDVDVSDFIKKTNASYTIRVTVSTVPDEDCTVAARSCIPDDPKFKTDSFTPTAGVTLTQTKEFLVSDVFDTTNEKSTVTAVRYYTSLTKTTINYTYSITYHYTSRFWGDQSYTVKNDTPISELEAEKYFTGTKTGARLTDEFIKNNTPYEKNFRQKIEWIYSEDDSYGAKKMVKGIEDASSGETTAYKLTAEVYSANTVNDEVKAEFLLPYKYNTTPAEGQTYSDKKSTGMPVYSSQASTESTGTEIAFDDQTYESFTIKSQVGRLFQYTNEVPELSGASHHASEYDLVEAAPYVLYKTYDTETNTGTMVDFHTKKVSGKRTYTGNSFKIGEVTYYKALADVPDEYKNTEKTDIADAFKATHIILTYSNKVHFLKPGKEDKQENYTDYYYAVDNVVDGYRTVYFFAYEIDANEDPVDAEGNKLSEEDKNNPNKYVFNGQYVIYSEYDETDGIIANNNYVKKYFTRWDIYNTAGEKVASSYYRQFNYSGYENYIIKPVYESESSSAAAEASNGLSVTISYLGDSRNQWKEPGTAVDSEHPARGNYNSVTNLTDATYAGDKIFADFAIAFNYNDQQLSTINNTDQSIKIGMVIEKLDTVQNAGGKAITDANYYAALDSYNQFDVESMEDYINYKLGNTTTNPGRPNKKGNTYEGKAGSSNGVTFVPIASNEDGFAADATTRALFGNDTSNTMLDNKNRLHYFFTFTQSADGVENTTTRPVNCVYRATSYIYASGNTEDPLVVSSPVYFTLYDIATR